MHAYALRREQLHNSLLQHHWRRLRTPPPTQKMKNIEIDGKKIRLQIVTHASLSGTPQDRTASAPLLPPITSNPVPTKRRTRNYDRL